jgi:hypothetical protein
MHQTVLKYALKSGKYALKHSLKGKVKPRSGYEDTDREKMCSCTVSLNPALVGGGWPTPGPDSFIPIPLETDPVPITQEDGWALGPSVEYITPTGI